MNVARIFADHAAGSPVRTEVAELLASLYRDGIGNPNGGHAEARRARALLDEARATIAETFEVESRQVTFTGSASEALALALSSELSDAGALLTTAAEHRGARALANRPSLLLADEPTANVDTANQETVLKLIREACTENGVSLMMVTHSQDVASEFDRIENLSEFNKPEAAE